MKDNANFAGIYVNKINQVGRTELLKEAKAKYNSCNSDDWAKIYFDEFSGGFNVYHKDHKFSTIGSGGDAEMTVGIMLAKYNGKQVEFLPESSYQKSPDIRFDNQTWDVKFIDNANENTIRTYIKNARKADNAIFYFTEKSKLVFLNNAIEREVGKFLKGQTNKIPDIFYMDKNGILKPLWRNKKGLNE
ncbi:hypothetical protein FACS1894162_3050 [Bacteroidia bacterium]|nr:hypothetical protein FACS1894162_3050 [Bacteroidia bacterium]